MSNQHSKCGGCYTHHLPEMHNFFEETTNTPLHTPANDEELREQLRALRIPSKSSDKYPIHAYEDDLVDLIQKDRQQREAQAWKDGYHEGWNAYNESPYNPHEAKLIRLGKDSV